MEPESDPEPIEKRDPMGPPDVACECFCLHCQRSFMSDGMWYQRVLSTKDGTELPGTWMCPTPNCDGIGYCFDIYPTDPDHPDNEGCYFSDDDDEYDEEFDEDEPEEEKEFDPAEPKYAQLDEIYGNAEDDIIEGDEWKRGVSPDAAPSERRAIDEGQREREEEDKRYDMPDERKRIIYRTPAERPDGSSPDDDIPF